ncbi:hypothetical protein ABEF95_003136 [Exophiala dermatitidis]|uniref:Uncharacterized protein n=1 Tax=Exophiala dermatitidis (strain ATCC 34100 / CBS 525.76 / NIH/UT8656) TaxID=858893 RepID=H6BL80_EXODN|nr:uncharacterized protein HMPREF1120_00052 [Exophiala dermatitidis NIH/UT8656]EHY51827.1 hypothetical protein HMPREF1120_00052 [Exophiala dermatitidis NIH/UT8656]
MSATKPSERLLRYPPMERQDLNQSQLGSFKFTPVDKVQSIDTIATNYLQQQLAESLMRAEKSRFLASAQPHSSTEVKVTSPALSFGSTDAEFFNKHIKPDLAESRLRLGPAAFRSAVDGGARSPTKQDHIRILGQVQEHSSGLAPAQMNYFPDDTGHTALEIPNMDPTAAAFVPTATLNQSLGLALVNEQQAHNTTREALRKEVERTAQLEDQIKKHQQQISRLTVTVNNLGAIIKHNLHKDVAVTPAKDKDAEEAALHDFYRTNPHLVKNIENLGMTEDARGQDNNKGLTHAKGAAATVQADAVKVDENQLYNFELLTNPHDDGSPISALRRTLRKQFSIAESIGGSQINSAITPSKQPIKDNRLIEISPESGESVKEADQGEAVGTSPSPGKDNKKAVTGKLFKRSDSSANLKTRLLTAKTPVAQLPTTLSNKCARQPLSNHQVVLKNQTNDPQQKMATPNLPNLWNQNEAGGASGADKSAVDGNNDGSSSQTSTHEGGAQRLQITRPPTRATVQIPGNFDGHPKWLVTKENPIFESDEEIWAAIKESGPPWMTRSAFADHPVRYLPEDAVRDQNAYRTVMMDEIPVGTTMKDVLSMIRGGTLESLQLLPPIGRATSFMTARVVFLHEGAADGMRARHQRVPFTINGTQVRVWKPIDPTYPLPRDIEDGVWGEDEASRILLIGNIHDSLFEVIPTKLARLALSSSVIEYSWTWDGYASIEFADIKSAFHASRELKAHEDLYDADFRFDRDYTSDKYEALQDSDE